MLILKARILMLYRFTNEKVREMEFKRISWRKLRTSRIRPTSALIPNALGQGTPFRRLSTQAEESLDSIANRV